MQNIPKCLMLPIDGTDEALRPIDFLCRLYPKRDTINLILCYFVSPLPPVYRSRPSSETMAEKKKELLKSRKEDAHNAFRQAKKLLVEAGFDESYVQEHLQEKAMSAAHHACQLADIRKVDAVMVQKRVSSALEGFLRDDPTHALLHHCIVSPVWFTEGTIDPRHTAICIQNEEASLRAADHAGFMLAESSTRITLLHAARSLPQTLSSTAHPLSADILKWFTTPAGKEIEPFVMESREIIKTAGIADERVGVTLIPSKGKVADEILAYTQRQGTGIVVLGHSNPSGTWSFLKTSVTKKILSDFKNMAVWVNQ